MSESLGLLWQRGRKDTGGALTWRGPWSGTEGGSVDHKGKMDHRPVRTKITNEESEGPKDAEMEVDGAVPQEGSAEIQSPTRKVIRVASEETQDHVRETLAISQEEAEEMGFVPSALGEPRGTIYWFDNRCSEEVGEAPHNQLVSAVRQ